MLCTTLHKSILPAALSVQAGKGFNNQVPFAQDIVDTLLKGQDKAGVIKIINLGSDFYVTLLMKDVLTKRAKGTEGFDPINGVPCFIFNESQYISWSTQINPMLLKKITYIDKFMYTYICAACSGELRHAPGRVGSKMSADEKAYMNLMGITKDFEADQSRSGTQKRFLQIMTVEKTVEFLQYAVRIFGNYNWGGGYGGAKWAAVAQAALDRAINKFDKIGFIDHAFDLKHNGGPIFDKNRSVDQSLINEFLDAKLHAKKDTDWVDWIKYCSDDVIQCLEEAKKLGLWTAQIIKDSSKPKKPLLHELYGEIIVENGEDIPANPAYAIAKKADTISKMPPAVYKEAPAGDPPAVEASPVKAKAPKSSEPDFQVPAEPEKCPENKH